jgi:hypothetical protein
LGGFGDGWFIGAAATLISSSLINWITFFKFTMGQFLIRIAILLLVAKFDNSFKMFLSEYYIKHADSFKHSNPCVKNVPLFTKCKSKYYSRYDFHNIKEIVS